LSERAPSFRPQAMPMYPIGEMDYGY